MTYQIAHIQEQSSESGSTLTEALQARAEKAVVSVGLKRTCEPVWPEDEQRERAELARAGRRSVKQFADEDADGILASVTVELPEMLRVLTTEPPRDQVEGLDQGTKTGQEDGPPNETGRLEPAEEAVTFEVPPTFSGPEGLILYRQRLRLVLTSLVTRPSSPTCGHRLGRGRGARGRAGWRRRGQGAAGSVR